MKKLICLVILCLVLVGCGYDPPVLVESCSGFPFIVRTIEATNHRDCSKYSSKHYQSHQAFMPGCGRPVIILPTGMFNIGDTIRANDLFLK